MSDLGLIWTLRLYIPFNFNGKSMTYAELASRLVLAFVFGGIIGIERQLHHKNAGLKTNTLVAVGACAFSLIAENGFGPGTGLSQVAGGVVTGIGFIGSGVILRHGGSVQGINSAATLWATASVGLGLGLGNYRLAILVFLLVLVIQFVLRWAANYIDRWSAPSLQTIPCHLQVISSSDSIDQVRSKWNEFSGQANITTLGYQEQTIDLTQTKLEASFTIVGNAGKEVTELGQAFSRLHGVAFAGCSLKAASESE